MFDLRNDVNETARNMFMNTYETLARENGMQNITIDSLPDFGRALQSLRNDIDVQIAGLRRMGFEGVAVAEAMENMGAVIDNHINNLATGPADDFAAQAGALMAEPEPDLFANAPAARRPDYLDMIFGAAQDLTRQAGQAAGDEMRATIRGITEIARIDPVNDTAQFIHRVRVAADDAGDQAVTTALYDLANNIETEYMNDQANEAAPPARQLPAARAPEDFDPETFLSNYIDDARRITPNDDLIRVTREVENIAQFLNMRDNTAEFATRLREAGDRAQSEITELTLYDLADQIETRMAEQRAEQDRRDFEPAREQEVLNLLNDPEIDPEYLRTVAQALDGISEYWAPLSEGYRRDAITQLRERANYGEFNSRNFAQRLATEAGLNIVELRDTVEALNNGQFDHEVLRGLPFAERDRSAQRTAMELTQLINQIENGEANIPQQLAQRDPVRDTVRNADIQVLLDALTAPERARVSAAVDQALLSNNSFEGEEGLSTARRLAQLIREYPIGFVENMMQVERELVARGIDAIADARELGIGNPPPEGNADGGPVRGYQKGGTVKKPDVPTPYLFSVPTYSETVAYEMYPGQKGQDDQRDAARHMLAAGTLSRKYGPKTAEFLGKAHEFTTSPLQAIKSAFGGKMPADYGMDTHNNTIGARLGQRAKSQAELEDLVQEEAERASRTQTQDKAFIKKANGGIVQQNPTTDQMRYALMMRRK
jgi:hypothetical protein